MIIEKIRSGYACELYRVKSEENEKLTVGKVEEKFSFPFGCTVIQNGNDFLVEYYTD